jgi:hypothetical protein
LSGTRFELSPSWTLAIAIVVLHAGAAAAVFTVLPTALGAALAAALSALGLAAAWSRALLRSPESMRALAFGPAGITLELKNGRSFVAEVGERRHVSRFMVTLPVRRPVRRTILVSRDMLNGEEFRRLRLWALWGRLPKVAPKQLPT